MKKFISLLLSVVLLISFQTGVLASSIDIEVDPKYKDYISLTDIQKTEFNVSGQEDGIDIYVKVLDKDNKVLNFANFKEDLKDSLKSFTAFNKISALSAVLEIAAYKDGMQVSNKVELPIKFDHFMGKIDYVKPVELIVNEGDEINLPKQVEVFLLNGVVAKTDVSWNTNNMDLTKVGKYEISGKVEGYEGAVKLNLIIKEKEKIGEVLKPQLVLIKGDKLKLPEELLVKYNTNKFDFKKARWNTDNFNSNEAGIKKVSCELDGYGSIEVNVLVVDKEDTIDYVNDEVKDIIECIDISSSLDQLLIDLSYSYLANNDMSDLKNFKNTESIQISAAGFKPDFKGICGLDKLKKLNIFGNDIEDISSIAYLNTVEELSLGSNNIKDLSPLKNFKNLKKLNLSSNSNIKDISALADLPLEELEFSNEILNKIDLTPLLGNDKLMINGKAISEYDIKAIEFKDGFASVETSEDYYYPPNKVKVDGKIVSVTWSEDKVDMSNVQMYDLSALVDNQKITLRIIKGGFVDKVVTFEDEVVTKAIRKAIDKPKGDIKLSDVINLKELEIVAQGASSLKGVENLQNLEKLGLYANRIKASQLIYIKNLTKLKSLDLAENNLMEIPKGSFDNLVNLEELVLDHTGINTLDKDMMSKLVNLRDLLIEENNFTNLDFLVGTKSIKNIIFRDNKITDISGIKNNENLEMFWGTNNFVSNISALEGQKNLNYFSMANNKISDISPLKDSTKLEKVYLGHNNITNIDVLKGKTFINNMELDHNKITDISALKDLINLERLYLNDNKISSFEPLSGLVNLRVLYLKHNSTSDYSPLDGIIKNIKSKDF